MAAAFSRRAYQRRRRRLACIRFGRHHAKLASRTNIEGYCVSEGWIRVAAGKGKDRFGNPLLIKLTGAAERCFKDRKEG